MLPVPLSTRLRSKYQRCKPEASAIALLLATTLFACPSASPLRTPHRARPVPPKSQDVLKTTSRLLQLTLADGQPCPRRPVKLTCGGQPIAAQTDAGGRLPLPPRDCSLHLGEYTLAIPKTRVIVSLPAEMQVEIAWGSAESRRTATLDSRVHGVHPFRRGSDNLWVRGGDLWVGGAWLTRLRPGDLWLARLRPGNWHQRPNDAYADFIQARRAMLRAIWNELWRHPKVPARPNARAALTAIREARAARKANNQRQAVKAWERARQLTKRWPPTSWVRAYQLSRHISRQVTQQLHNAKSVRVLWRDVSKTEIRLSRHATELKERAAKLFRAGNFFASLGVVVEWVALHTALAYAVDLAYSRAPVPQKFRTAIASTRQLMHQGRKRLLLPKVASYQRAALAQLDVLEEVFARFPRISTPLRPSLTRLRSAILHLWYRRLTSRLGLAVMRAKRTVLLPLALRGVPRGSEARSTPLHTHIGLKPLSALLGRRRTVVVLSQCYQARSWMKKLAQMAERYRHIGLRVGAAAVTRCNSAADERGFWLAGPSLLWALQAKRGSVVVLDSQGSVLWRQTLRRVDDAADAVTAWLTDHWSAFELASRRGLPPLQNALRLKLSSLRKRIGNALKKGRKSAALILAKQAAALAPARPQVQRQLALAAGHARDLTTLARRVRWWRQRYGDLSAELLVDRVRRETGTPSPTDFGRRTGTHRP